MISERMQDIAKRASAEILEISETTMWGSTRIERISVEYDRPYDHVEGLPGWQYATVGNGSSDEPVPDEERGIATSRERWHDAHPKRPQLWEAV